MRIEAELRKSESNDEQVGGSSIWIRGLYMLLFFIIARLAEFVVEIIALIQFVLKAATKNTNENLTKFGHQLSQYLYDIVQFQTFNSEEKPFPFKPWSEST